MTPRQRLGAAGLLLLASILSHDILHAATSTPFTLTWTAPGDDGVSGIATGYELRYSSQPLTQANYLLATRITGLPAPTAAGTRQSFVVNGLADGTTWYLALRTIDDAGNWSSVSNVVTRVSVTSGVVRAEIPISFASPWPNPARDVAHLRYSLPRDAQVRIEVLDVLGRHVRTLRSGQGSAGSEDVDWDLSDDHGAAVRSGTYLIFAHLGETQFTRVFAIVR
jgi:hypothetical protein